MIHELIQWDHHLFFQINCGLNQIPGMQYFLAWPTWLAEGYILFPVLMLYLWIWDSPRFKKNLLLFGGALIVAGLLGAVVKSVIDRPRPYGAYFRDFMNGAVVLHSYFNRGLGRGFPSGHVTAISSVAFCMIQLYGRKTAWIYAIVLWIGVTRIFVGMHYPADLIAGVIMGTLGAYLFLTLVRWLQRRKELPTWMQKIRSWARNEKVSSS